MSGSAHCKAPADHLARPRLSPACLRTCSFLSSSPPSLSTTGGRKIAPRASARF